MIPWGPWRPDASGVNVPVLEEARNVIPSIQGFKPVRAPIASSNALDEPCAGTATIRLDDGSSASFAGTKGQLYKLSSSSQWEKITPADYIELRDTNTLITRGGDDICAREKEFSTATGERWRFAPYGSLLIATNFVNNVQKFDLSAGVLTEDLGGSPPQARFIAIVRDFVLLGCINGNQKRVQWSAINNAEGWTPGTDSSDFQDFPAGGPVRGLIGGETGYVFQAEKINRMTFVPGSAQIFEFDEVEGGRGLAAPNSLVRLGNEAFYYASDGFYRFNLGGGTSTPIGVGKWSRWFLGDIRSGTELSMLGAVSPENRAILWPYISRDNSGTVPDRVLIYDWALDEAAFADIDVQAISEWLTQPYTMDGINSFGTLDELPYSLDSPFWRGGVGLLGLFDTTNTLVHLQGDTLEAQFVTSDGHAPQRALITGTRPQIDATGTRVAISMRERDGDAWTWPTDEGMEDTGEVPAHVSGNYARARVTVPAGANWTVAKGLDTMQRPWGKR